jgi:hypothetical protein
MVASQTGGLPVSPTNTPVFFRQAATSPRSIGVATTSHNTDLEP